jgi:hypothetical protein
METTEKRQDQRKGFQQTIEFALSAAHPSTNSLEQKGLGIDISSGGIGLETVDKLQRDDVVKLSVPLGLTSVNIPAFAEVRWVEAFDERYRIGLRFLA